MLATAANHHSQRYQPEFSKQSTETMSQQHRRQASLGQQDALIKSEYIYLNHEALSVIKGNKNEYIVFNGKQMSGQDIQILLPDMLRPIQLHVQSVQNLIKDSDVVTYTGYVDDNKNDFFTMSLSKGNVMAKINYGNEIYIIRPIKNKFNAHVQGSDRPTTENKPNNKLKKHTIAELDKRLMIKDDSDDVIHTSKQTKNYVEKSGSGSGRVDILFYHASDVNFPVLLAATIISEMNAVLARSGVNSSNYISSVGIRELNTTFSGLCRYWPLGGISNQVLFRNGVFSSIDQEMFDAGADVSMVLISEFSATGCWAGLPGRVGGFANNINLSTAAIAVSVDSYALGDLTAIHEIGHVLGGKHTVDVNTLNNTWETAKGKTYFDPYLSNPWQTIMGGYSATFCVFSGNGPNISCERISYFSNPNKYYYGVSTGDSNSNMKNWLNYNMPIVANWRQNTSQQVNEPNPISSNSELCFGFNSINWTAQASATEYKLYKSTNYNFSNPVLVYNGSNTSTFVNVNLGTWYLRAQACNSAGCSLYSNQVSASRYNGCL